MKDNLKHTEKSPCSVKITPVPELITCLKCGGEIEIWSDEYLTSCSYCGHKLIKEENSIQ